MPRKLSGKSSYISKSEKPQCHIHDKALNRDLDDIHQNVCVSEIEFPLAEYTDGKHYCLFHLPTKDKDPDLFGKTFKKRFHLVEEKIVEVENLSEEKRTDAKNNINYDFRYVWFPSNIELKGYRFGVEADFSSTTFSALALFDSATFIAVANFNSVTFHSPVTFESTNFLGSAYFGSATFFDSAVFAFAKFSAYSTFRNTVFVDQANFLGTTFNSVYFDSATFLSIALFRKSVFLDRAEFKSSTFVFVTDFGWANFTETSQVFFEQTNFCSTVDLSYALFAGYVIFGGEKDKAVFLDEASAEKTLQNFTFEGKSIHDFLSDYQLKNLHIALDLQNARLEKPERIAFHRVRLCPSWFINVDSRKIVFTDVMWDSFNSKRPKANIQIELKSLEKQRVREPRRLLEIAYRQLANNAEENGRYEEASKFRLMASETKRLEYYRGWKVWSLHWWYWLSSFYGESWIRASIILLILVLLIFPLIYTTRLFQVCPSDKPVSVSLVEHNCTQKYLEMFDGSALLQSLSTATFQTIEYRKPVTGWGELWITLEKIFAPLQFALLALAIRRKFMR
ncbi:MAG TPA: pentapeptide repeat-containing protein [Pyrinomonadaceae bacterium]|jgi:uncharacterized protein YjbI with pentapeptide repeats|nr:pentapeptide repeat-containing protein [Pyrinomonadaceae bacterium]